MVFFLFFDKTVLVVVVVAERHMAYIADRPIFVVAMWVSCCSRSTVELAGQRPVGPYWVQALVEAERARQPNQLIESFEAGANEVVATVAQEEHAVSIERLANR